MSDRRSHMRFRSQGAVVLRPADGVSSEVSGGLYDLSFRGIGVTTQEEIQIGVRVAVELVDVAPLKGRIALGDGEVVNVMSLRKGDTGILRISVRFTNADQALVQRLLLAIRRQSHQTVNRHGAGSAHARRGGRWL